MIRRHFKTGKHQHRLLHFLDSKTSDTKDLTLVGHLVSKKLNVAIVNQNTVLPDCELDFFNNDCARSFNSKHLGSFHDMVRRSVTIVDAWCAHDLSQAVALYRQTVLLLLCIF